MSGPSGRGGTARAVVTALLIGLVAVGVLLSMLPAPPPAKGPSATSTGDDGRRAAFLLLVALGDRPELWNDAPGRLPEGHDLLVLSGIAKAKDAGDQAQAPATAPESTPHGGHLRDPQHYRRFLQSGGTILAALDDERSAFLEDEVGLSALHDLERDGRTPARPRDTPAVTLLDGVHLEPEAKVWRWFEPLGIGTPFDVVAQDSEGHDVAVALRVGRGRLVLLADDTLFANDEIDRGDNALYLVRLVELYGPFQRILFDEYALGAWAPEGPFALSLSRRPRVLTLHLAALLAVLLWAGLAPRPFPRDPSAPAPLASSVRAEGLAGLLLRARRVDLLASLLRAGTLRRLAARVGLRGASVEDEAGLERLRASLAARSLDPDALRVLLAPADVRDVAALERYALDLERAEALGAEAAGARRGARADGHGEPGGSPTKSRT